MSSEPSDQPAAASEPQGAWVTCWRCGKNVALAQARCPYCAATFGKPAADVGQEPFPGDSDTSALLRMLAVFAAMLVVSLVGGLVGAAAHSGPGPRQPDASDLLALIVVLEAIDTVLVLAALAWAPVRYRLTKPAAVRVAAWLTAVPLLLAILAVNLAYHWLLRSAAGIELIEERMFADARQLPWLIATVCLQPAIVEELFFRYQAIGVLRTVTSERTAVLVSAAMFALAHVGTPLSMPVLFLLGIALGYARVAGGSVLLPMALHFAHNAAVLAFHWLALAKP